MWRAGWGEAGAFLSSYCRNPLPCDYELRAFSAFKKKQTYNNIPQKCCLKGLGPIVRVETLSHLYA